MIKNDILIKKFTERYKNENMHLVTTNEYRFHRKIEDNKCYSTNDMHTTPHDEEKIIYARRIGIHDEATDGVSLYPEKCFYTVDCQMCQNCYDWIADFVKEYFPVSLDTDYSSSKYKKYYKFKYSDYTFPHQAQFCNFSIEYYPQPSLDYYIFILKTNNSEGLWVSTYFNLNNIEITYKIPLAKVIKNKISKAEEILQSLNIMPQELIDIIVKYYHHAVYLDNIDNIFDLLKHIGGGQYYI